MTAAHPAEVPEQCTGAGTQRGSRQRVDQAAVDVEHPGIHVERPAGPLWAAPVRVSRWHYWYTLFAMRNPWDQRLGFWYIAEDHPDLPAVVACPSGVTLTFAELAGRAHQLVHALRAHGPRRRRHLRLRPAE